MTKIIVNIDNTSGRAAQPPAFVNGKALSYPINTPFDASDELLAVLKDSDLDVTVLPEGGSSPAPADADEGAAVDHGGAGGATSTEGEGDEPEQEGEPDVTPVTPDATETPAPNPLDHDGDGKPGGSLPGKQSTRSRGAKKKPAPEA